MNEETIKSAVRQWVAKTSKKAGSSLTNQTPIIEQGIINSLQLMDLIIFVDQMREEQIDVSDLKPGAFKDIDTIYKTFFAGLPA